MYIRFGYELQYQCSVATSALFLLHAQPNSAQQLVVTDRLQVAPYVPSHFFRDLHGNPCTRVELPAGLTRLSADGLLLDSGMTEPVAWGAPQHAISELPESVLVHLLPSRYCESDLLAQDAIRLFGHLAPGWSRVQAICDWVNRHIQFGYQYARCTKTALDAFREGQGVCRDFAHLAIALCRALNIPARYTTSYLGDIGIPPVNAPMDFAGAIEVFLGDAWHAFDPRNNQRRIGRLTIARGRDAADVAISTAFGPAMLNLFRVWTDEIDAATAAQLINAERSGRMAATWAA
jgi:transglutaminase-like putative cysteine protease